MTTSELLVGRIVSIVAEKGFGFLQPIDGDSDVFFHRSAIAGPIESLSLGQTVNYELDAASDKPRARSVVPQAMPVADGPVRNGFITKVHRYETQGFISADEGGMEYRFEPAGLIGDKGFHQLEVGDAVTFRAVKDPEDPRQPEATGVRVVDRPIRESRTSLPRHPRSRRKKPSWR